MPLSSCLAWHDQALSRWKNTAFSLQAASWEEAFERLAPLGFQEGPLAPLITHLLCNHFFNLRLWRLEDRARDPHAHDHVIALVKRAIDVTNQLRNQAIDRMNDYFVQSSAPLQTQAFAVTESPGLAVDRHSILTLKIAFMADESRREDKGEEHLHSCRHKWMELVEQREELHQGLNQLMLWLQQGMARCPRPGSFKMYNDPLLNPYLYRAQR